MCVCGYAIAIAIAIAKSGLDRAGRTLRPLASRTFAPTPPQLSTVSRLLAEKGQFRKIQERAEKASADHLAIVSLPLPLALSFSH